MSGTARLPGGRRGRFATDKDGPHHVGRLRSGVLFAGARMSIVDDYGAIARRMRELKAASPKDANEITELERWRDTALGIARDYVQARRRGLLADVQRRQRFALVRRR